MKLGYQNNRPSAQNIKAKLSLCSALDENPCRNFEEIRGWPTIGSETRMSSCSLLGVGQAVLETLRRRRTAEHETAPFVCSIVPAKEKQQLASFHTPQCESGIGEGCGVS